MIPARLEPISKSVLIKAVIPAYRESFLKKMPDGAGITIFSLAVIPACRGSFLKKDAGQILDVARTKPA
jgi:hypothetical protein